MVTFSDPPPDDLPRRIAHGLRTIWRFYERYSTGINGLIGVSGLLTGALAFFAPDILRAIGTTLGLVISSDVTHTLLLLALLVLVVMTRPGEPGNVTRADGGQRDALAQMAWALLFTVSFAILGGQFGDQWVVPFMLAGLFLFLITSGD